MMNEKTNEELARFVLAARSSLGGDRDDLDDENDELLWDGLTEAAARLRQQSEDSARLDWLSEHHEASFGKWADIESGPPLLWFVMYEQMGETHFETKQVGGKSLRAAIDKARQNCEAIDKARKANANG